MRFFKGFLCRVSLCVMACMVMLTATAFASKEDVDYIKEVFAVNEAIDNGQAWMNFTALSPLGKANIELNITGASKPQVACKGEGILTYTALWGDSGVMKAPFYLNEEDGHPVLYWNYDNKWSKVKDNSKDIVAHDLIVAAVMAQFKKDSTIIKDAEIVFDNNIQRRVKVLIDGKEMGRLFQAISDAVAESQKDANQKDAKAVSSQEKQITEFVYANLGDLPLFYTVDVATNRITSAKGDFSPVVRNVADSAIKQFVPTTPDQREVIDRLLESFTFTFDAVYTMHNGVKPEVLAVPAEAKNAEDVTAEIAKKVTDGAVDKTKKFC